MNSLELAHSVTDYVADIRHVIHENPELSYKEFQTTALIVKELKNLGIEVTQWDDFTGAVGLLKGAKPGPTIGLRADIDALPIQEESASPHTSKNPGVMHACAHDAHTAILLGVAKLLSEEREQMPGNVKFIFQPAEETPPGGALTLIEKGVLENPKVDALFALHHATENRSGQIGIHYGQFLAAADQFTLTVTCKGGGGSAPHKGVDGIPIAAEIILALHVMMTRRVDPVKSALISFGTINAGSKFNILADEVVMTGTCRSLDPEISLNFPEMILKVAQGIAGTYDAKAKLDYMRGYPALENDDRMTTLVEKAAGEAIGIENVKQATPLLAGDDLAYFFQKVPGSYFWLGITPKTGIIAPAHTAKFDIDESSMEVGVAVLHSVVHKALAEL
ncbi:MAG TPA: amidohydrolase [Anaerolineae bacterium]|nr:amidohydrolase [Anaerolineae bacterium]